MPFGALSSRTPRGGRQAPAPWGKSFPCAQACRRPAGFTLIELLTLMVIFAILLGILLPVLGRARAAGQSVACLSNLRQIAIGFQLYTEQNGNALPDPMVTQVAWERSLDSYVQNHSIFACPADNELFWAIGSSYDWRDTAYPDTTLAGRDVNSIRRFDAVLAFDSLPGWHRQNWLNVVRVDGSALSMGQDQWLSDLDLSVTKP